MALIYQAVLVSLEGALGKIALRTRSAPRQLLQVQPAALSDDLANAAGGENHPGTLTSVLPKTAPVGNLDALLIFSVRLIIS